MTQLEIINDTVAYYSADPGRRALMGDNNKTCAYRTFDGRMCAVGRWLTDSHEFRSETMSASQLLPGLKDSELKPEVREYKDDIDFWEELQRLHDTNEFWSAEGLTAEGQKYADHLRKKYGGTTSSESPKSMSEADSLPPGCSDMDLARILITHAVYPMLMNCGNSYVNAYTEQWLYWAQKLGAYQGPVLGSCKEVSEKWEQWLEEIGGSPELPDSPRWVQRTKKEKHQ